MMSGEDKFWLGLFSVIVAGIVTVVGFALTYNAHVYDMAFKAGLCETQSIGTTVFHWEKCK